jgi:hypothetical protein
MNLNKGVIFCWALVAAACGFMLFGPTPGAGDQDTAVKATVDGYVRAFAAGNGKAACDSLTQSAQEAVAGLGKKIGANDCPTAMVKTRQIGGSEVRSIAKKIRVRKVDVDGGRAKVTLRAAGQDSIAELERTEKGWKISSLPKA